MNEPGRFAEPRVAVAHEDLVALVLLVGVVLDEVVEAPHVARVVVALAAAADRVPDLDGVDLGVVRLLAREDDLRAVVSRTVAVVRHVGHVGFHHSVGVDGVPAVEDHGDGESLVAEGHEAPLLAVVEYAGVENLLARATPKYFFFGSQSDRTPRCSSGRARATRLPWIGPSACRASRGSADGSTC